MLQRLWREQRLASKPLPTRGGGAIQVVFPGWLNRDSGPDFRGAILSTETGDLLKGDVEVHVHAADWRGHGHHLDHAYDGVVLHVAWRGDRGPPSTVTASGTPVREVSLEGVLDLPVELLLLAGHADGRDPRPCVRHFAGEEAVAAVLDRAGEERFLAKAGALASDAAALGADQALYRALLDALGYSKNRAPFRELAERVPYVFLEAVVAGKAHEERLPMLQAVLLGAAGLLPKDREQGTTPESGGWRRLWREYEGLGVIATPWETFRVRPQNAPVPRVLSAAALVERFVPNGPVEALRSAVDRAIQRDAPLEIASAIAAMMMHRTHGLPGESGIKSPVTPLSLVARRRHPPGDSPPGSADHPPVTPRPPVPPAPPARPAEMAVNVVLPFFHAWALERRDARLAEGCLALYRAHPDLAQNQVTREMERMLLPSGARRVVRSAARQQGLMHLYKRRCARLLCQGCDLAGSTGPVAPGR